MSSIKTCAHLNQISDSHEGTIICTDCGLVLDQIYITNEDQNVNYNEKKIVSLYDEMLNRLNLSITETKVNDSTNIFNIAHDLYKNINKDSAVTLKEISTVTGVTGKKLSLATKGSITLVDKEVLLDKYCCQLGLTYKQYTVIKELLNKQDLTGHNPLTIISSCIYYFCRENKVKLSMKKITDITGISCISIQRFLKQIRK